ncbi:MAG: LLM class flavin-dependent oxidoreductase [Paracoccaceae bacterium]
MDIVHFLSSHMLDPATGGKQLYRDVIEQAVHADRLGYHGVGIPEHHLVNILLIPSPLQMAVAVAARTQHVRLMTSICQLPLRDMRVFAGEVVQAQALCEGRLMLGVGKGAFAVETEQLGVPFAETKPRFEEALKVLEALLGGEDVSWQGQHYQFGPLTIMPRPEDPIPLMLAVMAPPGIEGAARAGYHVQTTPLGAGHQMLLDQVNAFHRGKAAAGPQATNRLSLQRGVYLAKSDADAREKIALAYDYYRRFDNVFGGPGLVDRGIIRPIERQQTMEELGENLMICTRDEMIDRLATYAEIGIDDVISTSSFGQPQGETLEMMDRFASEVMPHITHLKKSAA